MGWALPTGYYGSYTILKNFIRVLFKQSKFVQSAELNDVQTIIQQQIENGFDTIYQNGARIYGNAVVVTYSGGPAVQFTACEYYTQGIFVTVPATTVPITGIGTEIIYLVLTSPISTGVSGVAGTIYDSSLLDPASGAEAFGKPAADRQGAAGAYNLGSGSVPVCNLVNGQITNSQQFSNLLFDQFLALLAEYFYQTNGSYLSQRPGITEDDTDDLALNPTQFSIYVDGGIGFNQGYEVKNIGKVPLAITRPFTGQQVLDEPQTFLSGTTIYTLNNNPILSISRVAGTLTSGNIAMVRGSTLNGEDAVPSQDTPLASIVSVTDGTGNSPYRQGVDFQRIGNNISWIGGGGTNQPAPGASYTAVVTYNVLFAKAVRVLTAISNEAHTTNGTSTTTLTHSDVSSISSIPGYVNGTDYQLNATRTAITWLTGPPTSGTNIQVTYQYWSHSTEGDYLGRDTFQDSSGDILYDAAPATTVNGNAVNYQNQIAFQTSSGNLPVINTDVDIDYQYTLGRMDVLAWNSQGVLVIQEGTPSTQPGVPNLDPTYLPIATLDLPPEATAETYSFNFYDNLTMTEVDLRTLLETVDSIQYDLANFELQINASTQAGPTGQIGILADSFQDANVADVSDSIFNGTFDFFNQQFLLPRTTSSSNPAVTSTSNIAQSGNIYMLDFDEVVGVSQPLYTKAQTINQFGAVNTLAQVTCSPQNVQSVSPTITVVNIPEQTAVVVVAKSVAHLGPIANALGPKDPTKNLPKNELVLAAIPVSAVLITQTPVQQGTTPPVTTSTPEINVTQGKGKWDTVAASMSVTVQSASQSVTMALTGTGFRANDRAIVATLDGVPIAMTASGSTAQETFSGYTAGVKADSNGHWTANVTIPSGTPDGSHVLQFVAHDLTNIVISSIATCSFTGGLNTVAINENVTILPPTKVKKRDLFKYLLCLSLACGPPSAAILSCNDVSHVIAYVVAQSVQNSITLTITSIKNAIISAFNLTTIAPHGTAIATAWSAVLVLASTNVQANASILLNLVTTPVDFRPWARSLLDDIIVEAVDPLAQTFNLPASGFITSIDLFNTIGSTQPVLVSLADTANGIPDVAYNGQSNLAAGSILANHKNNFPFVPPIFSQAGDTEAFIVATNDTACAIETAVVGQYDINTGTLVAQNPAVGTMLESSNGQSWATINGQSITFNVNMASFTQTQGIINFGQITFSQSSCAFAFNIPYVCPDSTCSVQFQYSLDGNTWYDFAPLAETSLGGLYNSIYLRVILNGTSVMSPVVYGNASLTYFVYQTTGTYTHRRMQLSTATVRFTHVYVCTDLPGNTSMDAKVTFDESTWHSMTEVTGDRVQLSTTIVQRHFVYDAGSSNLQQNIRTRIDLNTTVTSVSPAISSLRVVTSAIS